MSLSLEETTRLLLHYLLGEGAKAKELVKTPSRVAESLRFLTSGYHTDEKDIVSGNLFETHSDDMIIIRNVELFSLCEHHMLPFFGVCHIGYIPNGRLLGLSQFGRIVDLYARRLQIQERLTRQIAECIQRVLNPKGVGVVIEANHLCMKMRGIQKQNSLMKTSCMLGCFRHRQSSRLEFLELLA